MPNKKKYSTEREKKDAQNAYRRSWAKKTKTPLKYRIHNMKHHYGITIERYNEISAKQGDVCAICSKPCVSKRNLSVDHDHNTGHIRGLLCIKCNAALGMLGDDIGIIQKALAYLEYYTRGEGRMPAEAVAMAYYKKFGHDKAQEVYRELGEVIASMEM